MGTHCHIGIMNPEDKTIVGTYIHYDGNPDNMVPSLVEYVREKTMTGLHVLIAEAQTHAGLRGLYRSCEGGIEFLAHGESEIVDQHNFLDSMVDYAYLIHDDTGLLETFTRTFQDGRPWEKMRGYETYVPV